MIGPQAVDCNQYKRTFLHCVAMRIRQTTRAPLVEAPIWQALPPASQVAQISQTLFNHLLFGLVEFARGVFDDFLQ